jgi:lambda family phage tail tape measure protein
MAGANNADVTVKLVADTASFDAKVTQSGQVVDRTAALMEKANQRVVAAWKREELAQAQAADKLREATRAKELAALKTDILARSTQTAAQTIEREAEAISAAGHAGVTSVQAASGAIRELEGNFTNNIRAVEKFVTMIPGVGAALKYAFPVVGALSFGAVLFEQIKNIRDFIKETAELPNTIRKGFEEINNAAMISNDALRVSNDRLQDELDKLQKKPTNGLQTALDEARQSADQLSDSLSKDISKVNELITKSKVSLLQKALGQAGTESETKFVTDTQTRVDEIRRSYQETIDNAADNGASPQNIADIKTAELVRLQKVYADAEAKLRPMVKALRDDLDIFQESGGGRGRNTAAPLNLLSGYWAQLQEQQRMLGESFRGDQLKTDIAPLKAAASGGSSELLRAMEEELNQQKLVRGENIKADYDFWELKKSTFKAGSEEYRAIIAKETTLALEGARQAAEKIRKFQAEQKAQSTGAGEFSANSSIEHVTRQRQQDALHQGAIDAQVLIDNNQLALLKAHNDARREEADIMERAGRTMTQYAAAVDMAKIHEQEFAQEMQALEGILHTRQLRAGLDPSRENVRAVAEAQAGIAEAEARRQLQVQSENVAMNGRDTSGLVGATDALNDFVRATRDSATQMRSFTDSTLNGLNTNIIRGISGQKTDFGNFGADMFRQVAGMGLTKAEGSLLSMFGFGGDHKKPSGSAGDPIYTRSADPAASIPGIPQLSSLGSLLTGGDSSDDGGVGSMISAAMQFIPGFADGGMIDPNQWAVVGEEGPELFHSGGGGQIIPNHKLDSAMGGGDTHHWNVDARGSNDPASVERAVMKAAPHIAAAAVKAVGESKMRRPSTRR